MGAYELTGREEVNWWLLTLSFLAFLPTVSWERILDSTTSAVTGLVKEGKEGDEGKDYYNHYSLLGLSEKFTARLEEGVRTACWYLE